MVAVLLLHVVPAEMTWLIALEVLGWKAASPPYAAVMLWVPAVRADVDSVAMPPAVSAPLPIGVVPSLNVTKPVGVPPPESGATAAVKVTLAPTSDGLAELVSVVAVASALS